MRILSSSHVKILVLGCILSLVFCSPPNVIIILADDLGYGDLGWSPFNSELTKNIQAPNLKAMAKNGMIMTNFHTASPICSPSRASLMVGLFPWRFGVDFIYAGDLKLDNSEEMDHEQLPLVPNIAMSFRDAGYYTAHIGKWHLGGQSHIDIPNRQASSCSVPGINQYGFDEYVGMSEGTNSMRYWTHQRKETYREGSKYLFRNDVPLKARKEKEILTDRQAEEAMRVISEQSKERRPFFVNLWFDAPHSPWEPIEPYYTQYQGKFTPLLQKYASMVTNMDMNIGRVLKHLDDLGIADNTIVVFTSDNGPENEAGSAGAFKGRKRLLSEGGIRVPMIVQWKGKIAAGSTSDLFMMTTDLWPTLTEAAGIPLPHHNRIDGVSLLPRLLNQTAGRGLKHGDERTVLWYTHSIGFPKLTAAWSHGYKVMWNDYEGRKSKNMPAPFRMYDMRRDPTENLDIMPMVTSAGECEGYKTADASRQGKPVTWLDISEGHGNGSTGANTQYKQAALHLLNHLHTKMHLFRHEGELDWTRYHVNKPYETAPHCGIRRSLEVDPFPFSNSLQVPPPEFCGASVYQQYGGVSCRCTAQQCDNTWTLGTSGVSPSTASSAVVKYYKRGQPILDGLSYISPESGSLVSYTRAQLVKWTDFQPRCEGADLLAESLVVNIADTCTLNPPYLNPDGFMSLTPSSKHQTKCKLPEAEWAMGNVVQQDQWVRLCHQRVALDTGTKSSVLLQPNSCGFDYPVLTIATHGMVPTFLSLCPESMNKFQAKKNSPSQSSSMDDNVMMVALNLLLLNDVSPVYSVNPGAVDKEVLESESSVIAAAPTKSVPFVASGDVKNVAIVDPLFFRYLGVHKYSQSVLQASGSEVKLTLTRKGIVQSVEQLWGFIAPYERRLSNSASGSHQLDYLVFPIYLDHVWSLAVIYNLRSSEALPSIVYFDPIGTSSSGSSSSSSGSSVISSVVKHVLSEVIRKVRHSEEAILLPITVLSPPSEKQSGASCEGFETSGLKVLLFVKNLKEVMLSNKGRGLGGTGGLSSDLLLKNVNNHFVETEKKSLMTYFLTQSKKDYGKRKRYLKNMSSKKMLQK